MSDASAPINPMEPEYAQGHMLLNVRIPSPEASSVTRRIHVPPTMSAADLIAELLGDLPDLRTPYPPENFQLMREGSVIPRAGPLRDCGVRPLDTLELVPSSSDHQHISHSVQNVPTVSQIPTLHSLHSPPSSTTVLHTESAQDPTPSACAGHSPNLTHQEDRQQQQPEQHPPPEPQPPRATPAPHFGGLFFSASSQGPSGTTPSYAEARGIIRLVLTSMGFSTTASARASEVAAAIAVADDSSSSPSTEPVAPNTRLLLLKMAVEDVLRAKSLVLPTDDCTIPLPTEPDGVVLSQVLRTLGTVMMTSGQVAISGAADVLSPTNAILRPSSPSPSRNVAAHLGAAAAAITTATAALAAHIEATDPSLADTQPDPALQPHTQSTENPELSPESAETLNGPPDDAQRLASVHSGAAHLERSQHLPDLIPVSAVLADSSSGMVNATRNMDRQSHSASSPNQETTSATNICTPVRGEDRVSAASSVASSTVLAPFATHVETSSGDSPHSAHTVVRPDNDITSTPYNPCPTAMDMNNTLDNCPDVRDINSEHAFPHTMDIDSGNHRTENGQPTGFLSAVISGPNQNIAPSAATATRQDSVRADRDLPETNRASILDPGRAVTSDHQTLLETNESTFQIYNNSSILTHNLNLLLRSVIRVMGDPGSSSAEPGEASDHPSQASFLRRHAAPAVSGTQNLRLFLNLLPQIVSTGLRPSESATRINHLNSLRDPLRVFVRNQFLDGNDSIEDLEGLLRLQLNHSIVPYMQRTHSMVESQGLYRENRGYASILSCMADILSSRGMEIGQLIMSHNVGDTEFGPHLLVLLRDSSGEIMFTLSQLLRNGADGALSCVCFILQQLVQDIFGVSLSDEVVLPSLLRTYLIDQGAIWQDRLAGRVPDVRGTTTDETLHGSLGPFPVYRSDGQAEMIHGLMAIPGTDSTLTHSVSIGRAHVSNESSAVRRTTVPVNGAHDADSEIVDFAALADQAIAEVNEEEELLGDDEMDSLAADLEAEVSRENTPVLPPRSIPSGAPSYHSSAIGRQTINTNPIPTTTRASESRVLGAEQGIGRAIASVPTAVQSGPPMRSIYGNSDGLDDVLGMRAAARIRAILQNESARFSRIRLRKRLSRAYRGIAEPLHPINQATLSTLSQQVVRDFARKEGKAGTELDSIACHAGTERMGQLLMHEMEALIRSRLVSDGDFDPRRHRNAARRFQLTRE